jgi:hypothetical protein
MNRLRAPAELLLHGADRLLQIRLTRLQFHQELEDSVELIGLLVRKPPELLRKHFSHTSELPLKIRDSCLR